MGKELIFQLSSTNAATKQLYTSPVVEDVVLYNSSPIMGGSGTNTEIGDKGLEELW